jgi:AcrR family transcriptional regulator
VNRSRGNAAGRATREALILTAERLFAEHGIDAVSLREIGREAGQGNLAAVQFHFGDKTGLLGAIVAHRAPTTNALRKAILDELAREEDVQLRKVIGALVRPTSVHVADADNHYISFQGRLLAAGTEFGRPFVHSPHATEMERLEKMLVECLTPCPPEIVLRRLGTIIEWMVTSRWRAGSC